MKNKIFLILLVVLLLLSFVFPVEEGESVEINSGILENIGNIISDSLANEDISVNSVKITKKGDESTISFLGENPEAKIGEDTYKNIDTSELAYLKLNEFGEIVSADLTASEETIFNFEGKNYQLPKGGRIHYENGDAILYGNSFEIKDKSANEFTKIDILGESLEIVKDEESNSVLFGNFKIGDDEINGKVTVYGGRVSEIWEKTDATINGINHQTTKRVKMYYNENFNPEKHQGENYFNYGDDKVSLGGYGFSSKIGVDNEVFGEGIQVVDLEATMNYGTLEISRDKSKSELAFNVESTGNFELSNGRIIFLSDQEFVQQYENSIPVLSDKSRLFVKTDSSKGFSYDMTLNGDFVLSDNVVQDNKGLVTHKGLLPWENAAYKRRNFRTTEEKITEIEKITGKNTFRNLNYVLKKEEFNKEIFENAKDIDVDPALVATFAAHEGWFFSSNKDESSGEYLNTPWTKWEEDENHVFIPGELGLTGITGYFEDLKKEGLISSDSSLIWKEYFGGDVRARIARKDAVPFFTATVKYFEMLAKKADGNNWNKRTEDQKAYLTAYFFNTGKAFNEEISPVYVEEDYTSGEAIKNAAIRRAMYIDFENYYSHP